MPKMTNKAVIIIAAVAVLAAAGGVTSYFLLRDRGVAAVVNGVKITEEKVAEEVSKSAAQYEAQGMALQPAQLEQVRSSVIDNLVTREVLIQESAGIEITDVEIDEKISSFQSQFDTIDAFNDALGEQGFNPESFREIISQDMKIQKLIEERVPEETSVSDEEILSFYNENPAYFTEPERIHASHILVSLEAGDDDEKKKLAKAKIERIQTELENGADFAETAMRESEGPSGPTGGDLGEFTRGQMVSAFETVAFALPEGKISGIVETQFGYHLIKVHERYPESKVPLEDVKDSIDSFLIQDKNQTNLTDFLEGLKNSAKIRIPGEKAKTAIEEV
ncbi:MAG: peptidylprolyl isomerase [Spirochaetales bacterium]|nr:peptidylprolyl isomerase [Spirochaetales bacterium]